MNLKKLIVLIVTAGSLMILPDFSLAQSDPVGRVAGQLDKWITAHPQEKACLQTDKTIYAVGDNIWFKAYVVVGSQHRLSAISGILNVDLIDENNFIVQSLKLPLNKGLTWGDFELADSLKEGNYRLRAYTNWMRNAGEDYFFSKNIIIVNSITNNVFTKTGYTYTKQNGGNEVNININYKNIDGKPFAGSRVNYKVMLGAKSVAEGKGVTDTSGNLRFSFVNTTNGVFTGGRIITRLNPGGQTVTKQIIIKALAEQAAVQFFPEGGTLINGNNSKIAFKAVGADGLGADVKGILIDDQGKQAAAFGSTHLGMGEFNFTPARGRTYRAKFTFKDGSENSAGLTAATDTGYSMSIDNSEAGYINVKIIPGSKVNRNAGAEAALSLVAQAEGVIYYAGKGAPGSTSLNASIPKNKFPTGIVQFTLFSPTGEPMNERLVFVENDDELKLEMNRLEQTYSPRAKIKIELTAYDNDGKPVIGSFSAAVTDDTKAPVDESSERTIFSNLLLTSDLKGYVEKPGYYFTGSNAKTRADLDVLMLTQGFSRFEWKQVLNNTNQPILYQPEKALQISGYVKTPAGKPVAHANVLLLNTKSGFFMIDTISGGDGKFTFNNLIFKDSLSFTIQARTAKGGKNVHVELDTITPPPPGINKNAPDMRVNINDGLGPLLQNSKNYYDDQVKYGFINGAIRLKEVVIKERKARPEMLKHSGNLNGPGNADRILLASDIYRSAYTDIIACLRSNIKIKFKDQNGVLIPEALIIIDGVQVSVNYLLALNVNDIESIEFLTNINYISIYGVRGEKGVIVITTKRGDSPPSYTQDTPGLATCRPKGYSKVREFYSPQYDNPKAGAEVPDRRSTVYWKPNIITGNDGKAAFEYFNAGNKGTYRVVIEGIDGDGNLGRKVYRYNVE